MSRPAIARINLNHLRHNYRLLKQQSGASEIMAIVKANAYGHGMALIGPVLLHEGCRHFGVTDASEGSSLRQILAAKGVADITLLSGIFDRDDAEQAVSHQLTPAITETAQLGLLRDAGFRGSVWIKVDTGMNRLGAINPQALIDQGRRSGMTIRGIMSHLACADAPEHPLNRQQAEALSMLHRDIAPDLQASLLNSAGMVSLPEYCMDMVRPGIALYGSEPIPDQALGLKPVMTVSGQVMQIRQISAGDHVSYGATFTATRAMSVAIISMGYADGLPRALSHCGHAVFEGKKLPIVGRVCMDYTMVDVSDVDINPGDAVEFWGENILANDVADLIGTISYTLFTGIGERVPRVA